MLTYIKQADQCCCCCRAGPCCQADVCCCRCRSLAKPTVRAMLHANSLKVKNVRKVQKQPGKEHDADQLAECKLKHANC